MKNICIVFFLCSIALVSAGYVYPGPKPYYDLRFARYYFEKFIIDFDKHYTDAQDKETHFRAFIENLIAINKYNKESPTASFGINQFADEIRAT